MSMSNCVNDDRILTLCDMTGGLHTFNIGIEETFEMLEVKVREKLQLKRNKYDIYFFNNGGIEKKHKNEKVNIVDSEPDFMFIVDIKPLPKCFEENEVYDLEIVHTINYRDINEEIMNNEDNEERRISMKTYKVSEDSFIYSMFDSGNFYNYLCTFDENKNEWVSTRLPKNVFHVYPDGSYVEDKSLFTGYSYLNTTVYIVKHGIDRYLVIKNKDDNTEITNINRCFNRCIPLKFDKYILFYGWSQSEKCNKIYIIDAVTTSIKYVSSMYKGYNVFFIDNEHIGIRKNLCDEVLYKINFLNGDDIDSGTIIGYIGNISYNIHDNTYQYGKVEESLLLLTANEVFNKWFIFINRSDLGKIDILRIKNY